MIKSIKLTNFFSFKDETIHLNEDINLLVGINGSGKSNLFKALELLKMGVAGNRDTALQDLIISKYGGFGNIYCKASDISSSINKILLTFEFNVDNFSDLYDIPFPYSNIKYEIQLVETGEMNGYTTEERLFLDDFEYLTAFAGANNIVEEYTENKNSPNTTKIRSVQYNPRELALAQITDYEKDTLLHVWAVKRFIKEIQIYNNFDTSYNSQIRKPISATSINKTLLPDGSNLAQILNRIKINYKKEYRAIIEAINEVNPHFKGFDFNFFGSGTLELLLDEGGLNSAVHIAHLSDGTLRFLCLLVILFNPDRGKVICLDEPEMSLHPDMIHGLAKLIEKIAEQESTTFLIATHSPHLLDKFKLENVRVFEKDDDNVTTVDKYSEEDFEGWYEYFNVGQMWRAGDIGGKRW